MVAFPDKTPSARGILRRDPIPGTRRSERPDENLGAAAIELTPDDLREIEGAASKITVQGARYPEEVERMTGR